MISRKTLGAPKALRSYNALAQVERALRSYRSNRELIVRRGQELFRRAFPADQ